MVKSARVQRLVIGDDVTLSHQIMEEKAYDAALAQAPVTLLAGDTVKCFYPLADGTNETVGYAGAPVGSLPSSEITVEVAGVIAASGSIPARGSQTFAVGLGQPVRIEITRSGGDKETHYLYNEVDVIDRGFPEQPQSLNLT